MELSERKLKILEKIILSYIESGEPVGSKFIALDMDVSSATVRNEMSYLSDTGFLLQPHTSAGRIPSQRGYRIYIDKIMERKDITEKEKKYIDSMLGIKYTDPKKLLSETAETLSRICALPAFAITPDGREAKIKAVQFVQLSRRSAMIIMMSSIGVTKHALFKCDFDLTPEILRIFFRVFNEKLSGKTVSEITPAFIQSIAVSFGDMMLLMSSALRALLEVANDTKEPEILFAGRSKILFSPEYTPPQAMKIINLLDNSKDFISFLLSKPKGTSILLGNETGKSELSDSSIIVSKYSVAGSPLGAIGVIGPMRMDYKAVIANIDYVSKLVGEALTDTANEE